MPLRRCSLLAAPLLLATPLRAQPAWPSRPVRLIVPFPPGGGVDLTARLLADPLARELGQNIVVENKGGAGGVIGVEAMANSPADGYTLSLDGAGTITAGPHLRRLPYDPFGPVHVTRLVRMPFIIAVRSDLPETTLAGFLAWARTHELRWASGGIGTSQHLAGELFKQMSGLPMVHVPYRGTGPALNDLAAKVVDAYPSDPATMTLIRAGTARAMAVTSPERWPLLPETPAAAEAVPGYEAENWYEAAPAGHAGAGGAAAGGSGAAEGDGGTRHRAPFRGSRAAPRHHAARGLHRLSAARSGNPGRRVVRAGEAACGWTASGARRVWLSISAAPSPTCCWNCRAQRLHQAADHARGAGARVLGARGTSSQAGVAPARWGWWCTAPRWPPTR
jgi:tripartite-type tricarboxylate transporter receptor subunit TctC